MFCAVILRAYGFGLRQDLTLKGLCPQIAGNSPGKFHPKDLGVKDVSF